MIPREVIEEVVARSDIEQIIGSYVTLKRAGSHVRSIMKNHRPLPFFRMTSIRIFIASAAVRAAMWSHS